MRKVNQEKQILSNKRLLIRKKNCRFMNIKYVMAISSLHKF